MPHLKRMNNRQKKIPLYSDHAYNTRRWRKERESYLSMHPYCTVCKGFDHVEKVSADSSKFWLPTNWQAMCSKCHQSKTKKES